MGRGETLIKNSLLYAVANFGSKILAVLLLPLYTKFISTEDFGVYDIVISTFFLLQPFATLQMENGIFRNLLTAKSRNERISIISNGHIILLIGYFIFFLLFLLTSTFLN